MDPYKILGISPSASDEEVKKAYRTLSKKYHPDANINNPNQEAYTEKFKEVQNAYKTIMDNRKRGFYQSSYTGQGTYQHSSYQFHGNDEAALQEAAGFINARRFQEALDVLEQVHNKSSIWFYYSAIAMNGVGNNITALQYAKTALQMEPTNFQYMMLVQQLQGGQSYYRKRRQAYDSPGNYMNFCYNILLCNCLINCCCGFRIC